MRRCAGVARRRNCLRWCRQAADPVTPRGNGFDLHAAVVVPPRDRARLERLCRYALRPPIATDRLHLTADGQVILDVNDCSATQRICSIPSVMHLITKVKQAWTSGSLWWRARRYMAIRIWRPVEVVFGYARLPSEARKLDLTSGLADHRALPSHVRSQPEHLRRLMAAYRSAKRAEVDAPDAYRIRGVWADFLAVNFSQIMSAANAEDLATFGALLEDHYRERFTSGMGGDELKRTRGLFGRWYTSTVWNTYFQRLRELGFDPARDHLMFPYIGNPAGPVYQGSVLTLETLRHIYHATERSSRCCVELNDRWS